MSVRDEDLSRLELLELEHAELMVRLTKLVQRFEQESTIVPYHPMAAGAEGLPVRSCLSSASNNDASPGRARAYANAARLLRDAMKPF
jgi:hypothetical protein